MSKNYLKIDVCWLYLFPIYLVYPFLFISKLQSKSFVLHEAPADSPGRNDCKERRWYRLGGPWAVDTECPKFYRISVMHLLKYIANLYLSRCSTDLGYILGHSLA